jgi:signal transduction histidine kinase
MYYQRMAYDKFTNPKRPHLKSFILTHMGVLYAEMGNNDTALKFYDASISNSHLSNDKLNLSMSQNKKAELYESIQKYDSGIYYARQSFDNAQSAYSKLLVLQSSSLLVKLYKEIHNVDSAFFFLNIATNMIDSLYGSEKFRKLQVMMLDEQQHQQSLRQHEEQFRNKIKFIALLSVLSIFLLLAFILFRNNRRKQKANILLSEQKSKVEETLAKLKLTQAQLIQSEKMASLGELTAGIAHEIQNPLNFVNNFSEVNTELIAELKQELQTGNKEEAISIADDIKENEEKINLHGKRADAIVKGMLQHSRTSAGKKEPVYINALADEYLRLSYHGLRAKDKIFNATLETDFDKTLDEEDGKINIVPQEIGRVLLNLFTNAFYAAPLPPEGGFKDPNYRHEPTIWVSTKKVGDKVLISVRDNGPGIPPKILDKIFQPFFTTKPAGEGTGLGLSLSYDIIKSHGGEITVKSEIGKGTVFCIELPS